MDDVLKQRLVGAAVLIALAVIFVPMLFDAPRDERLERQLDPAIPQSPNADEDVRRLPLNPEASRLIDEDAQQTNRTVPPPPEGRPDPDSEPSPEPASTQRVPLSPSDQPPSPSTEANSDAAAPAVSEPASDNEATDSATAEDDAQREPDPADPATASALEPEASPEPAGQSSLEENWVEAWRVQVASFSAKATADQVEAALSQRGHQARIDRIERGGSVLYRIQTGPYPSRALATEAAETIDAQVAGVAPVVRAPQTATAAANVSPGYAVQVGSFTRRDNAQRLHADLTAAGFEAFYFAESMGTRDIWRVRVGTVAERSDAERLLERLRDEAELEGLVVSHP